MQLGMWSPTPPISYLVDLVDLEGENLITPVLAFENPARDERNGVLPPFGSVLLAVANPPTKVGPGGVFAAFATADLGGSDTHPGVWAIVGVWP